MNRFFSYFSAFLFFSISSFASLENLPSPYCQLKELKPFKDHGWYQNKRQLRRLIRKHKIKTIVEVGSWLGQSTIDMAAHLPPEGVLYAVDHWEGSIEHQQGQSAAYKNLDSLYEQFLSNIIHAKLTHKVIPLKMTSLEAAKIFRGFVDLIYLDASHDTESVYLDLCAWYPFVAKKGIMCGDDWGWPSVQKAVVRFAEENQLKVVSQENFWRLLP